MKFGDVRGLTNRHLLPNLANFKPTLSGRKILGDEYIA